MIAYILDPSHDVRQAAAYGMGVAAQFGGEAYTSACLESLDNLFKLIHSTPLDSEEGIYAKENGISAIGKICHFVSGAFDTNRVLEEWLKTLPIVKDDEESTHTYTYLMDLIQAYSFSFQIILIYL